MKTVRTIFPKPYSTFHRQVQTHIPVSGRSAPTTPSIKNIISGTSISNNNYDITPIDYIIDYEIKCKNKLHIIIINLNQLKYTKRIINDLLVQTEDFDLTIFDQHSGEKGTEKYYDYLLKKWPLKNCTLNIVKNTCNAPLNHVWNWFYANTTNEYIAFLNNDMEICDNFVSDAIKIFELEKSCGMIVHPTNNKNYKKLSELKYQKSTKPFLQGWDFIIRRNLYKEVPSDLWIYSGDVWLLNCVLKKGYYEYYDISSPIIHYTSSTVKENKTKINGILQSDLRNSRKYKLNDYNYTSNTFSNRFFKEEYAMETDKKIIVSLTTYPKRIHNIQKVLDSILNQSKKPDKIVINLSIEEYKTVNDIPKSVLNYIKQHEDIIEIFFVEGINTKVYKKIIPTLLRYKNDLIICIDDDFIYPKDMILDFYNTYLHDSFNPISGNRINVNGMNAHCGCASLIQYKHLSFFADNMDRKIYENIPASDIFYTYAVNYNGYKYVDSKNLYFTNMTSLNKDKNDGYSKNNNIETKRKNIIAYLKEYF